MKWLAAVALATFLWALLPSDPSHGATRRWSGEPVVTPSRAGGFAVPVAILASAAVVAIVWPGIVVWALMAVSVGTTGWWLLRRRARQRAAQRDGQAVAHACEVIAGQLRIGQIPAQALTVAAADCDLLAAPVAAIKVGGDAAEALRTAGRRPGQSGFVALGQAWELCERTGAPIAAAASAVADAVRDDELTAAQVASELAGARATGVLMAFLPIAGIAMGFIAGGNPVRFLTGTTGGQLCLAVAIGLACVGLVWTELLAASGIKAQS